MIGACGGVGCTVALGLTAMRRGWADTTGLASELKPFRQVPLPPIDALVLGGHEIRRCTYVGAVEEMHRKARVFDEDLLRRCRSDLRVQQRDVRPGTLTGASSPMRKLAERDGVPVDRSPKAAVERLSDDIRYFRKRHALDRVVVVHVASTEPPAPRRAWHHDDAKLERALARRGPSDIPCSSLYALAAISAECAYVNFTPSTGMDLPVLRERADRAGLPYMGRDGKTGETLVKSALAPLFAVRNLRILSWIGENILGNRDGEVLRDPRTRISKLRSKDRVISRVVGYAPFTKVGISYVPSLHDWKVAWDFVHFAGFLDTKMSLQFTWNGSDSLLAAPLVIDLARFAALELQAGRSGTMRHLACFFKDPMECEEHNLHEQWQLLVEHTGTHSNVRASPRPASPLHKVGSRGVLRRKTTASRADAAASNSGTQRNPPRIA